MKMREGRVTRRAAAVEEAPAEAAQQEKKVRPAKAGDEKLSAGSAEPAATVARVGFAPIVRVDAVTREVELCATSEALDRHGTVFDYAASKDAFNRWIGNVREMHERRAVGTRVAVRCDDETHRVFVRIAVKALNLTPKPHPRDRRYVRYNLGWADQVRQYIDRLGSGAFAGA